MDNCYNPVADTEDMRAFAAGEQILNDIIREVLEEIGVETITIEPHINPENILDALRQDRFDLAIVTNSDFSPFALPDLIRQIKIEHPNMKVITISGYATKEIVNSVATAGTDVFMELPFKLKELQEVVKRFM